MLQGAGATKSHKKRGKHRIKRERAPLPGMMLHQDASTHRWIAGAVWDLVVTMDDATGEHTSMFFCQQEGTASSFHGIGQTIARYGLFASLYSDRGSHYFTTPEARGRSERAFQTHQGRLPQELARAGIKDMASANRYLEQTYRLAHNREFAVASTLPGTAYVPFISGNLPDILCEQQERRVDNDNCVSFDDQGRPAAAKEVQPSQFNQ